MKNLAHKFSSSDCRKIMVWKCDIQLYLNHKVLFIFSIELIYACNLGNIFMFLRWINVVFA
jgi:hypothetical protein